MKITKFEPKHFTDIRSDIQKALDEIGAKYDINIKLGDISYTNSTFTSKINAATKSVTEDGQEIIGNPKWKRDFIRNHSLIGLKESDFGKTINILGKESVIVGMTPRKLDVIVMQGSKYFTYNGETIAKLIYG